MYGHTAQHKPSMITSPTPISIQLPPASEGYVGHTCICAGGIVRAIGGVLMTILSLFGLQGCSPGYVIRAAYEQGKILYARQEISDVLNDEESSEELKGKLHAVLDAREYAISIGLDPGKSYTKYARVEREPLSWVVMGARRDSFLLANWWFPFVGNVPYKGFFDKEDADEQEAELVEAGYETWVRPTDAFSTLGWFNDPILSTTLKYPEHRVVNTVIHESVHSTVWVPGQVPFNESLANFLGTEGAIAFYERKVSRCDPSFCEKLHASLEAAKISKNLSLELSGMINNLYSELDTLYSSSRTSEEKINEREVVFNRTMEPIRARFPNMQALKAINNAEIMQLRVYMTELKLFEDLFVLVGKDYRRMIEEIKKIAADVSAGKVTDPFMELRAKTHPVSAS